MILNHFSVLKQQFAFFTVAAILIANNVAASDIKQGNGMILVPDWIISGTQARDMCKLLETLDEAAFVNDFIQLTLNEPSRDTPLPRTLWLPESPESFAKRQQYPGYPAHGGRVSIETPPNSETINQFQRAGLSMFIKRGTNRNEILAENITIRYQYLSDVSFKKAFNITGRPKNKHSCSIETNHFEPDFLLGDSTISINKDEPEAIRYRCFWSLGLRATGIVGNSKYGESIFNDDNDNIFPSAYDFLVLSIISRTQFENNPFIHAAIRSEITHTKQRCRI